MFRGQLILIQTVLKLNGFKSQSFNWMNQVPEEKTQKWRTEKDQKIIFHPQIRSLELGKYSALYFLKTHRMHLGLDPVPIAE